ncbi:hypothetical protein LguiA_030789 [Lonicera macranthoides]
MEIIRSKHPPDISIIWKHESLRSFNVLVLHLGSSNTDMPPQRPLLPTTDIALAFAKTPFVGNSPSKLLKDKFKLSKEKFTKNFGTIPDKLLLEISRFSILFKDSNEVGIDPSKKLPSRYRFTSPLHLLSSIGISPDNLFSDASNSTRFFMLPTWEGMGPTKWF